VIRRASRRAPAIVQLAYQMVLPIFGSAARHPLNKQAFFISTRRAAR
jgi:hypothetical protein